MADHRLLVGFCAAAMASSGVLIYDFYTRKMSQCGKE